MLFFLPGLYHKIIFPRSTCFLWTSWKENMFIRHALVNQRRAAVVFLCSSWPKLVPQAPLVWMTFHNTYYTYIDYISICGMRVCVPQTARPNIMATHYTCSYKWWPLPTAHSALHTFSFHNVPHTSLRQHNLSVHHPLTWKKDTPAFIPRWNTKASTFRFSLGPSAVEFLPWWASNSWDLKQDSWSNWRPFPSLPSLPAK